MKKILFIVLTFSSISSFAAKLAAFPVLQVSVLSNLPNLEAYWGLQNIIRSGHRFDILNLNGYTVHVKFYAKFCYNNICEEINKSLDVIDGTTSGYTYYFSPMVSGLGVGAYPMYANTRVIVDGVVYKDEKYRTLSVKPFPYD